MANFKKLLPPGITSEDLAQTLDLHPNYMDSILSGRYRPGAKLVLRICELCPAIKPRMLRPDIFQ